jgi:dephospho-CoA kinase
MFVIGLTGGIASGKSTVSRYLQQRKVALLDADAIAHELSQQGKPIWKGFVEHFGRGVLSKENVIQRNKIGQIVFSDERERQWLDHMTHPLIQEEIFKRLELYRQEGQPFVVLDIPLLFETGWDKFVNAVWVVYVDEATQLRRLQERDGFDEIASRRRIASQMSLEVKKGKADVVIDNRGLPEAMIQQVDLALTPYLAGQEE